MITEIITGLFIGSTATLIALAICGFILKRRGYLTINVTQVQPSDNLDRMALQNLTRKVDELRCDHDNLMGVLDPYLKK